MNKRLLTYFILIVLSMQSCSLINTLTKRQKTNYVNYNMLFADPTANNALRNKKTATTSLDNRVRVITINQITGDTIIEWLKPIEAENATKSILPVKDLTDNLSPTQKSAAEEALNLKHKAIVISYTDGAEPESYRVFNDTVFISTDSINANRFLLSMTNKYFADDNPNRLATKLKDIVKPLFVKKEEPKNFGSRYIDKEKQASLDNASRRTLLNNTNTIVGDLYFDTDPKAETILDVDTINQLLRNNYIKWQSFKCKAHIKLKTSKDNKSFNANLRMLQDSITWASISLLGIEFVRAKISTSAINLMDYTKNKFFIYNPNKLESLLNIPIAFNTLQNFIIGNPPVSANYQSMLAKRNSRGVAIKLIADGTNAVYSYNADSTLRNIVIVSNKGGKSYSISAIFDNYQQSPSGKICTHRKYTVIENKKTTITEVSLNKFDFDLDDLEFPYKIPEKFKAGN